MAKRGPKFKQLDLSHIESLAKILTPDSDIAAIVGCDVDTLTRNYAEILARGRATAKTLLRQVIMEKALKEKDYRILSKMIDRVFPLDAQVVKIEANHSGTLNTEASVDLIKAYQKLKSQS